MFPANRARCIAPPTPRQSGTRVIRDRGADSVTREGFRRSPHVADGRPHIKKFHSKICASPRNAGYLAAFDLIVSTGAGSPNCRI